jgi:4-hydroxy-tetrahydrodipicolinate synthase
VPMLRGSMVALVTPMKNGAVDEPALRALVRWQIDEGIDGLVPCGTTGEGATLTAEETLKVVRVCVEEAKGRVPVIAGCGSNSTAKTIENVRLAKEAGADHALIVTPYYNKPTQEGLFRHFEAVAQNGGLPLVLYNVPSRTSVDLLPDTIGRLSKVAGIAAVKEASGSIVRVAEIQEKCEGRPIAIFAGDDMFTLATLAMGGQGVISVVGNVAPRDLARLCDEFFAGNLEAARRQQIRFAPLVRALFCETNPMPVKHALAKMGRILPDIRLPLVPISQAGAAQVEAALKSYGIA